MIGAAAALALLAAGAAAPGDAPAAGRPEVPRLFIAEMRVETAPGTDLGAPLRATIVLNEGGAAKVASAREWFPRARPSGGRLALVLEGRAPPARAAASSAHRRASFVVDYDEPAVAALRAEVARRFGERPTDEDLTRFVDAWIERKGYQSTLDVASTVAAGRGGDCTEHAVLLAAVARMHGRAARVVFGVALADVGGEVRGFGHAWTEIHDGRRWNTFDAIGLPPGTRYLPLGALAEEGPGYVGAAWQLLSPIDVRAIRLEPAP